MDSHSSLLCLFTFWGFYMLVHLDLCQLPSSRSLPLTNLTELDCFIVGESLERGHVTLEINVSKTKGNIKSFAKSNILVDVQILKVIDCWISYQQ